MQSSHEFSFYPECDRRDLAARLPASEGQNCQAGQRIATGSGFLQARSAGETTRGLAKDFTRSQPVDTCTMDNFFLSNGDVVPGISFQNRVLKTCPGLLKTQFIQESPDHFRIRFVPGQTFSQSDLDLLRSNLRRFLPENVRYTFEQVLDIPREASGKTRFCISHVNPSPVVEIAAQQH